MLYECNNPIIKVISVSHLRWKGAYFEVNARPYSALAFRVKGEGHFVSDKDEFFVCANDILYIPQGMSYNVNYTDTEMYVVHFVTLLNDTKTEIYTPKFIGEINSLFLRMKLLWDKKEIGYLADANVCLYKILSLIHKSVLENEIPQYFKNAISFIKENFSDSSLNIEKICRNCGCGETQLRKLFKAYYCKTPIEYITDLRLEFARNLITENNSIEESAYLCGFNDPKYFSRVVKQKYGCCPKDLKLFGK